MVEKDVLRFQISVRETVLVDVVKSHQHLFEVVAADAFAEGSTVCNVVEKLTSFDCLLCNVGDRDLITILLGHC